MTVLSPPNTLPRIDEIFAYVSVDADGNEGICAFTTPDGVLLPMVAADATRLAQLTAIAEQLADLTSMRIRLVRFSAREELQIIDRRTGRA